MNAEHLRQHLEAHPDLEVLIHDSATADDLPVARVETTSDAVVLHVESGSAE